MDHSIPIYPIYVLAMSRVCDTMIARRPDAGTFRMARDFQIIGKTTNPFIGLLPYSLGWFFRSWDYQTFKKDGALNVYYPRTSIE